MKLAHCDSVSSNAPALSGSIEKLIGSVGTVDFGQTLFDSLSTGVGIRYMAAYTMSVNGGATSGARFVFGAAPEAPALLQRSTSQYVSQFAARDPARTSALQAGLEHGTSHVVATSVPVRELADHDHRRMLENVSILERIALYVPTATDQWVGLHMMRDRSHGPVSDLEFQQLQHLAPVYAAFVKRHIASLDESAAPRDQDAQIRHGLRRLCPALSPRELEVCVLMLTSHSASEIGVAMQVGVASVHTYRKRAYQKLGVNGIRELFLGLMAAAPQRPGEDHPGLPQGASRTTSA